jgi:hypothetical protein
MANIETMRFSFNSWDFDSLYLLYAAIASMLIRATSSALKAMDSNNNSTKFHKRFYRAFSGYGNEKLEDNDYWHPYILGFLEIATLPPLLTMGLWQAICGWIALKSVPQWKIWCERRSPFNRFLICNLLMLIASAWMLRFLEYNP